MMKFLLKWILPLLLLLGACSKEKELPVPAGGTKSIHYSLSVEAGASTRAALGENDLNYHFEPGDRIYMEGGDGKLYGFLTLSPTGVGKSKALFEGDLTCEENFNPASDTPVSLILVSPDDQIHTIENGKVTGSLVYNPTAYRYAPSLKEAVRHFSHFTGSGNYGDFNFTVTQQSTFLVFTIRMSPTTVPEGTSIETSLLGSDEQAIWDATVSTFEAGKASFVIAFPGGTSLSDTKLSLAWTDSEDNPQSKLFSGISSSTGLLANNYYNIARSTVQFDGFRIKAKYDGTEMTFKYKDGTVQFSTDLGDSWYNYDGRTFKLSAEEEVCFQGTRKDCDCNGTTQLFSANKVCYIAGKIGSLLKDDSSLADNAFRSAFSNGNSNNTNPDEVNFVDIDPTDPLILPSVTSKNCYREMFRKCTSLTSVPALPATQVAEACYFNMFRACSGLTTAANIKLPDTDLEPDCYRELFRQCTNLTSVPEFPATGLAARCYQQMLSGCTSLTSAPALPATVLAESCYQDLFSGCTNLSSAPELHAPKLEKNCYYEMFYDCKALTSITCLATDISAQDCTKNWMQNVPNKNTCVFYKASDMENENWPRSNSGIPNNWQIENYTGE